MRLSDILNSLEITEKHADDSLEISGLSYDSRKTSKGDLFFAVSGFETDGHKYIPTAVLNGARAVVCERKPDIDIPYVIVENCRLALAISSCNFFDNPSRKMKIIGITGTNGKTTSSYLLKHIIESVTGAVVGLIGTNGNIIGDTFIHTDRTTPESYELQALFAQMYEKGCSYVVMEVSSHSLKLDRVAGICFDAAEFTNLTQDHLDFHKTMEDYAESKKILFSRCRNAVISSDDEWSSYMMDNLLCDFETYSCTNPSADFYADEIQYTAQGVDFFTVYKSKKYKTHLSIPGHFSVMNALGVLGLGVALGFNIEQCVCALNDASGVKGRVEIVPNGRNLSIIIDYAHTPDALNNVIQTLKPLTKGRLFTVFGCGGDRDRAKRPIMGRIVSESSDVCVVTSDNPRTEKPESIIDDILGGIDSEKCELHVISDRVEAIGWSIDNIRPGDVLLLAGKGHEDYQEIGHCKIHMDEREIVQNFLKEKV